MKKQVNKLKMKKKFDCQIWMCFNKQVNKLNKMKKVIP